MGQVMKAASNVVKTGVWIKLDHIESYCIMILMALHKAYQEMLGWKLSVVSGRMEENSYYKGVCADH